MAKRTPEDTKLLLLPSRLLERLARLARRQGVSTSEFAAEALEQTLKVSDAGVSLSEAVDFYRLMQVQRAAGAVQINRTSLESLVKGLYSEMGDDLRRIWREAGVWYGEFLSAKLKGEGVLGFLEKALLVSWSLDEAEVRDEGDEVSVRFASFLMPLESTELLVSYLSGVMQALGFEEISRDCLQGMAVLGYRRSFSMKSAPSGS
jgi:hypothetical protein